MKKSFHVFVCSTYRDLVSERNAVYEGLEELASLYHNLTYFCPRSIQPVEGSKTEIYHSDVLILILGHLHGVISPGSDLSYGESEYLEGLSQGKKILVYFRDEKAGLFPSHFEREPTRLNQLKTFKEKLTALYAPKMFNDQQSLVKHIHQDLLQICLEIGLQENPGGKLNRFKAKSSVTRKTPILIGALAQEPLPEASTRTIPIFQKALATPFQRRRASKARLGKTMGLALVIVLLAGFAFSKIRNVSIARNSMKNSASHSTSTLPRIRTQLDNDTLPSNENLTNEHSLNPGSVSEPLTATTILPPPKLKTKEATVVLMDDADSTKSFLRKAMDGSAVDQFQVGEMYATGKDVPLNDSQAVHWYRKAAEQGWSEAQYQLALMYRLGKGTSRNSFQAARWFQAAAAQGNAKAQVKIGQMLQSGKGVVRNETAAFKWFLKAADQKNPEAERIIAQLKEN